MHDKQTLIQKYWAGTATTEEQLLLLQSLSPEDTNLEKELRAAFEADLMKNPQELSEQRSEALLAKILERKEQMGVKEAPAKLIVLRKRWVVYTAYAAAILLIIAGLYLLIPHVPKAAVSAPVAGGSAAPRERLTRYSNTGNSRLTLGLPDSSTVILLPNSAIAWQEPGEQRREVRLDGTAYFRIKPDAKRPFTVYANTIATTVLGTEFTVDAAPDGRVIVRLVSGKVRVYSTENASAVATRDLKPGEEETIDKGLASLKRFDPAQEKEGFSPASHIAREPNLVFDKTPLPQVFKTLTRRYRLHFTYENADIRELQFTGTFLPRDSLPMVLSVICTMNGLGFQQQGDRISIYKMK